MKDSNAAAPGSSASQGHLSLWDTVSIIIGIVVGAGIYETSPLVFQNVGSAGMGLLVWAIGGALSLTGALCYAELAATYPRSGGDYVYLSRAFGRWAGFLFGWCQLSVLMTGSIGMMAYIFADYGARLWGLAPAAKPFLAAGAVMLFSLTNISGVVMGRTTQNALTWAKVIGIGGILVTGFLFPARTGATAAVESTPAAQGGSIGLAMVLVLYTYGGWNDAALVAAEIRNKQRNIPRALVLGTLLLTLIYLLINGAYLSGLGFAGARASSQIAADLVQTRIGSVGAQAISILVIISALGAINGLIYTGSRIYFSMGADFRFFTPLARWNDKRSSPVISLAWQCVITLLLILIVGTAAGQGAIDAFLGLAGVEGVSWERHGGFDTLLRCSAPVFWLFFLATGVSLFVLRYKDAGVPRVFRVPLYPLLPLIFCGMCSYMLYSATLYAGKLVLMGLLPVIIGVLTYVLGGNTASIIPPVSQQIKQETTT